MNRELRRIIAREWLIAMTFGIIGFVIYLLSQLSVFAGDALYNYPMICLAYWIWISYFAYLIVKSIIWAVKALKQK